MSKRFRVRQSNRLAPKIHQNTKNLEFSIRQNNLNRKFGLNLNSHDMPLHDSSRNQSHRSVIGVPKGYFFRRGRLQQLLPESAPVRRYVSPFIALTALIATTTFKVSHP